MEVFLGPYRAAAQQSIVFEAETLRAGHIRSDIQGLRAIAVLAVILTHIWPGEIPGGFVGVDVFFVISGYLITGSLFYELQRNGKIALWRFYVRRMKRLLPAALLVLVVVAVLSLCLLPPARWEDTAIEILASAFYLENWRLAWLAVDYLGSENVASPVQHFWSLSIEEQFYIFWPLLMIAVGAGLRRFLSLRSALMIVLLLILAVSFGACVLFTEIKPEAAYFVTYTRIWELGLGGVLAIAVLPNFSLRIRESMRTAGLAAIVLAAFAYSAETAFPGYAALVPTLGCALVIAAGNQSNGWSTLAFLAARPARYLGDISYSVYLWHWPMIVFAGLFAPDGMTLSLGLALIAATLLISHFSKRFVEDPIRYAKLDTKKVLAFVVASGVSCIIGGVAIYNHFALQLIRTHAESSNYPGARAFLAGADVPAVDSPLPPPIFLGKDKAEVYKENCHLSDEDTALNPCIYGPETGAKILLVGDSHAANWAPALISQADKMRWRLETHTKSGCPLFKGTIRPGKPYLSCDEWRENLLRYLRTSPPDLVIFAQSRAHELVAAVGQKSRQEIAISIAAVWRELSARGIKIVAIRDTPRLPFEPGDCIARDPSCYAEQSKVLGDDDPIVIAHNLAPEVPVIDMTDAVCQQGKCPMVVGNVIVWRDRGHLTASYSRTLATALVSRVVEAASDLQIHSRQ
jgi:peptidoglycan/LPS O-acetylase OafA/YrhL